MRKIRYALFPLALRLLGMAFILIALYNVYTIIREYKDPQYVQKAIGTSIGFLLIGFIVNTTCTVLKFDTTKMLIRKRMYIFGIKLSDEVVRVPKDCKEVIIRQKNQRKYGSFWAGYSCKLYAEGWRSVFQQRERSGEADEYRSEAGS